MDIYVKKGFVMTLGRKDIFLVCDSVNLTEKVIRTSKEE